VETAVLLAGRAIFGGYFLYNGINHFVNRDALVEYARAKGVPPMGQSPSSATACGAPVSMAVQVLWAGP
jgi:uncharacterized membrane protein YphA (DoxX/SURF4 family)